jgi:hypothetical protein
MRRRTDLDDVDDEAYLWFLPGPEIAEEDVPPGALSGRSRAQGTLFDSAPWHAAQAALARELAEVAGLFGALDQRLRDAPAGWRARLALREAADLGWWTGDRLGADRIALWVSLRTGSTEDTEQALARAGWAMRHLASGPFPVEGLAAFLERAPRPMMAFSAQSVPEMALADLAEVMAAGERLHPIVAAARLFHAWRSLGPSGTADIEAAVLSARHAALMSRTPGQGALFLPLAQTGSDALRGAGEPEAKLTAWLRGAERATLASLLHFDRVAAWRVRAAECVADLSGRTPPRLLDLLESWPQITAPMAEVEVGASRAAVQRNLAIFEERGLVREITGQGRYRVWSAVLTM